MILYSDDDLLVVDKPGGLRVIPDGYDPALPTLVRELEPAWGRLFVVHRLDKDTTGVILFARNADCHRVLNQQFAQRQVQKTYWACAAGAPEWEKRHIGLPLRVNADRNHRTLPDPRNGKPASTDVSILRRYSNWCLVEACPHSGYTHQIRAHLSAVGLPLLGDPLYKYPPTWKGPRVDWAELPAFPRAALHALRISFTHPVTNIPITFEAPLPDDLRAIIEVN